MKIFFRTFGCKVNISETEAMSVIARNNGFTVIDDVTEADFVVINSCTVTANSDRKVFSYIRKITREYPNIKTVLTGCLPQAYRHFEYDDIDIVIGNANKLQFIEYINQYIEKENLIVDIRDFDNKAPLENTPIPRMSKNTRAFLKIEDGCDRYCSYCIVPYARGNIRSLPIEEIRKQASLFANNNYKEIVLTGINLSSYGKGTPYTIVDAVEAAAVDSIERIRLSSLEPDLMTEMTIEGLGRFDKLCAHFHLSLQSGSNNILSAMNRRYTVEEYINVVDRFRKVFSFPTFTTDIMVGFPLEIDDDFKQTVDLVSEIGFLKCHVFTYSPRKTTKAATLEQIPPSIKRTRMKEMLSVTDSIRHSILLEQIGTTERIIVEAKDKEGYFEGYTNRYVPVAIAEDLISGDVVDIEITSVKDNRCIANTI